MTKQALALAKKAAVLIGAAWLVWFVGAQGLAATAARGTDPMLLSRFDPGKYPTVGVRLAQVELKTGHNRAAAVTARPAALAAPMNVRGVRVLGLALDTTDKAAATRTMRAAERLSWRDTQTSLWVLRDAALTRDMPRILNQVDALARRQKQADLTSRIFYSAITDEVSRNAFAELLARAPPWRSSFFASMRVNLPRRSYDQMELFLNRLDRTGEPPSAEERLTFIDRMADSGDGARARAYWLRTFGVLPAARLQTPYDPQFQISAARRPSTPISPFDWSINQDADQFASLRRTDKGPVLDLSPGATDGTTLLSQTLVLSAGSHRISTVVEGPSSQAPAGWQLICLPYNTPLIRRFDRAGDELSGVSVEIPVSGCSTQRLLLAANGRLGARSVLLRQVTIR